MILTPKHPRIQCCSRMDHCWIQPSLACGSLPIVRPRLSCKLRCLHVLDAAAAANRDIKHRIQYDAARRNVAHCDMQNDTNCTIRTARNATQRNTAHCEVQDDIKYVIRMARKAMQYDAARRNAARRPKRHKM